jgi:hypothetical protein
VSQILRDIRTTKKYLERKGFERERKRENMNYNQVCQIKREVERARTGERDGQTDRQRVRERRR